MNIFHHLMIKIKRILPYSILFIILFLVVFTVHNIYASNALMGDDLLSITKNDLNKNNLIIYVRRGYPSEKDWEYNYIKADLGRGGENIWIFGDGEVLSLRGIGSRRAEKLEALGFKIDATWRNTKTGFSRRAIYHLSSDQLMELLALLGSYKGELLPGERVADHLFSCEIRIIYGDREGWLYETVGLGIENEKHLDFIDEFIDRIREIEWQSQIEDGYQIDWINKINTKLEMFGYFEPQLKGKFWGNVKTAWDAHGIEYDEEWARGEKGWDKSVITF